MDTTGKAFVAHWTYVGDKSIMKRNTANSLQAACRQVLSVDEGWEDLDVTQIDVDGVFKRFVNKRGRDFKPESLLAYKRRFALALKMFKEYVNDPEGWKPMTRERNALQKGNGDESVEESKAVPAKAPIPSLAEPGLIEFPFPLRGGRVARLRLPADLKMEDVRRLTAFIRALAVDFEAPEA